jgi:hypothetical protein
VRASRRREFVLKALFWLPPFGPVKLVSKIQTNDGGPNAEIDWRTDECAVLRVRKG